MSESPRMVRGLEGFIRKMADATIEAEYDAMVAQIARLTAERDALRRGHDLKSAESAEYERAWRLQGIREGLEAALKTSLESRAMGHPHHSAPWAAIHALDPEQVAAEADKEDGDGND